MIHISHEIKLNGHISERNEIMTTKLHAYDFVAQLIHLFAKVERLWKRHGKLDCKGHKECLELNPIQFEEKVLVEQSYDSCSRQLYYWLMPKVIPQWQSCIQ
jgi:hypothetical protein